MAETMLAITASVKAAAAATAASISASFTGATAAAGTASTISKALSIGSALASIGGGVMGYAAKKDQASQIAVQEAQMKSRDAQERASLAEEYADLVADQEAVQLANGLNPNVGTPASVRTATREFAERNLRNSRENTRLRSATMRMQRRSLYKGANTALLGGMVEAGGTISDMYRTTG